MADTRQFKDAQIDGVVIEKPKQFSDKRGWLCELFRKDELDPAVMPVMAYISLTHPEVARGPHAHADQTDYFVFTGPEPFRLWLWDDRTESPTYNNRMVRDLGGDGPEVAIVPPGVVHAYKNIGQRDSTVLNLPNRLYAGEGKKEPVDEVRFEEDPDTPFTLTQ